MDIGRSMLPQSLPRRRLDAGTFGTMGVGFGFAIAAAHCHPDLRVVCVEGDSAFGFSSAEFETICRYRMNVTVIIVNNNGIYNGPMEEIPEVRNIWRGLYSNPAFCSPALHRKVREI